MYDFTLDLLLLFPHLEILQLVYFNKHVVYYFFCKPFAYQGKKLRVLSKLQCNAVEFKDPCLAAFGLNKKDDFIRHVH